MVKKRCTFKNLEENLKKPERISKNSKNLEKIQKTCRKFRKPGENFQKTFGHPVNYLYLLFSSHSTKKVKELRNR